MRSFDIIATSVSNLFKRKTRTFLTLFGVVLGAASVTLTFALGKAVTENSEKMINNSQSLKFISVFPPDNQGENDKDERKKLYLDDNLISKIKKIKGVKAIIYQLNLKDIGIFSGKQDRYGLHSYSIKGVDFKELENLGLKLINNKPYPKTINKFSGSSKSVDVIVGRYFEYNFYDLIKEKSKFADYSQITRLDYSPAYQYLTSKWDDTYQFKEAEPFVTLGKDKMELYISYPKQASANLVSEYDQDNNDESATDDEISGSSQNQYKRYKLNEVGRLDWESIKDDYMLSSLASDMVYIDLESAKNLIRETKKLKKEKDTKIEKGKPEFIYNRLEILADSVEDVENITKEIKKERYQAYNDIEAIKNEELRSRSNQFILGLLGVLALIVSAISVTNTMVTSVSERFREIGVMKVLGCKIGNIQLMFLLESMIIGLLGGLIGVLISYEFCKFMNSLVSGNIEKMGFWAKIITDYTEGMRSNLASFLSDGSELKMAVMDFKLGALIVMGCAALGVIAGYFPSLMASRISVLKAIRSEQ